MAEENQMTTKDVLDAVRRGQPRCDQVVVENPMTADEVLTAFEATMAQRQDLGVVNRASNLFFEPRNPFEPERARKPRTEAVLLGMLLALVVAAFLFFNLAAPRLQVDP